MPNGKQAQTKKEAPVKEVTPNELYAKYHHEALECDCGTDKEHMVHTDLNGEMVVECLDCKRFLKFPAEKATKK